jgi:hypothetical protein
MFQVTNNLDDSFLVGDDLLLEQAFRNILFKNDCSLSQCFLKMKLNNQKNADNLLKFNFEGFFPKVYRKLFPRICEKNKKQYFCSFQTIAMFKSLTQKQKEELTPFEFRALDVFFSFYSENNFFSENKEWFKDITEENSLAELQKLMEQLNLFLKDFFPLRYLD